jgi:hypothetical protein
MFSSDWEYSPSKLFQQITNMDEEEHKCNYRSLLVSSHNKNMQITFRFNPCFALPFAIRPQIFLTESNSSILFSQAV